LPSGGDWAKSIIVENMRTEDSSEKGNYSLVTREIRISVVPSAIMEKSEPESGIYAFAYSITIENLGKERVQLLERHWVIMSAGVQIAEVVGPGVVGEQPVLASGETFQYTSGAVIQDPIGSMQGTYTFRLDSGKLFDVVIPRFDLHYPINLH
jgi:ApaG protein